MYGGKNAVDDIGFKVLGSEINNLLICGKCEKNGSGNKLKQESKKSPAAS